MDERDELKLAQLDRYIQHIANEKAKVKEEKDGTTNPYKELVYEMKDKMYEMVSIIGKLEEENQKQRDRIAELEKCNLNLQEQIDKLLNHNK